MIFVVTLHAQIPGQTVDDPIVGGSSQISSQEKKAENQQPSTSQPTGTSQKPSTSPAISVNTPSPNLLSFRSLKMLPGDLIQDQKAMWKSPAKIHRKQLLWLAPFSTATAALLILDERANREVQELPGLRTPSNSISRFGGATATFSVIGAFALYGQVGHNNHAGETGFLGLEALIDSALLGGALKLVSQRSRPLQNNGEGRFLTGGSSFPSGHAITTWALATVIADEYPDRPVLRYGALGWAAAISLSRIGSQNHFPSDVFVGATFGYLIGHYVAHHPKSGRSAKRHLAPRLQVG
jgi:membrane-associated phospholipid phosphatase